MEVVVIVSANGDVVSVCVVELMVDVSLIENEAVVVPVKEPAVDVSLVEDVEIVDVSLIDDEAVVVLVDEPEVDVSLREDVEDLKTVAVLDLVSVRVVAGVDVLLRDDVPRVLPLVVEVRLSHAVVGQASCNVMLLWMGLVGWSLGQFSLHLASHGKPSHMGHVLEQSSPKHWQRSGIPGMSVLVEVGELPVEDVDAVIDFVVASKEKVDVVSVLAEELVVVFVEKLEVDASLVDKVAGFKKADVLDLVDVEVVATVIANVDVIWVLVEAKKVDVLALVDVGVVAAVMANVDVKWVLVEVGGLKVNTPLLSSRCEQTSWYIKDGQLLPETL